MNELWVSFDSNLTVVKRLVLASPAKPKRLLSLILIDLPLNNFVVIIALVLRTRK